MAMDPHRTLGVPPGASAAEIKRAYRRLAKEFHPDAAGEVAVPRFLAIQAAYEALIDERGARRVGPARGSRSPWEADPERARATRQSWRARPRPRPDPPPRPARPNADGPDADPSGSAGARPRRPQRRATPGSTSYDEAHQEPFDPEWSGGSWYGTTSGTYWTLNPKEYADPRKHGPEYQARGRRSRAAPPPLDDADPLADPPDAAGPPPDEAPPFVRPAPSPRDGRPWRGTAYQGSGTSLLAAARRTPAGRVVLALIGWVPIGVGVALVAGEVTGCARFAASCATGFEPWVWGAQLAIVALLLLVPALAVVAAAGSIAVIAAIVPSAAILSIGGGSQYPERAAGALLSMLAVAWIVGVVVGVLRLPSTTRRDAPVP